MITEAERQKMARGEWQSRYRGEARLTVEDYLRPVEGMTWGDIIRLKDVVDLIIDAAKDELRREFQANGVMP